MLYSCTILLLFHSDMGQMCLSVCSWFPELLLGVFFFFGRSAPHSGIDHLYYLSTSQNTPLVPFVHILKQVNVPFVHILKQATCSTCAVSKFVFHSGIHKWSHFHMSVFSHNYLHTSCLLTFPYIFSFKIFTLTSCLPSILSTYQVFPQFFPYIKSSHSYFCTSSLLTILSTHQISPQFFQYITSSHNSFHMSSLPIILSIHQVFP